MESDIQLIEVKKEITTVNVSARKCFDVHAKDADRHPGSRKKLPSGSSRKKEQNGSDLKLIMEPQNPSPTKYFDSAGVPLRKAIEAAELPSAVGTFDPTGVAANKRKGTNVSITCRNCDKIFTSRAAYDEHYRTNYHQEPIYTCPVCDKQIEQYRSYHLHCYRHRNSANQRYMCMECSKAFHQKSDLVRHQKSHLNSTAGPSVERNSRAAVEGGLPRLSCTKCDASFGTQAELKDHTRKTHPNLKQLVECPDCGKSLSAGGFYAHRQIHSETPKFSCQECGRTFVQKINLIHHHKIHIGDRPFQCEQCNKAFCEKAQLQRHLHLHSEERPFRCDVCGKCYKTERCLKVHSAVHTNDRPYVCTECNKGFLSSSKLRQHSNIHSGLRPFKCKYCTRDFTNFPNWLKHIRRRHKVDHRTGEKLDSVPKFMTKKKPPNTAPPEGESQGDGKERRNGKPPKSAKPRKRPAKTVPLADVLKEESLPYVSESSNIDLNLVSKDDLLQPLTDEIDIFKCFPSDESKLSIPDPLEQIGSNASSGEGAFKRCWNQSEIIRSEVASSTLFQQENALDNAPSELLSHDPLLFEPQMPIFPTIISVCDDDEQQFRIMNPHCFNIGNADLIAGNLPHQLPGDNNSA